ncbi:hypothetical protein [Natrinema sp. SYSU A 869]|uniref:hypothetical protein n=1 Tax=Natrinema sp. SYSU A 869 TaxID=2871694 RepID=UPI001CA3A3E4|nr:hypothetical protein [Natrinema sp. SYSU A 869]
MMDIRARVRSPIEAETGEKVVKMDLEGSIVDNNGRVSIAGSRDDMLALGKAIVASTKSLPEEDEEEE